MDQGFRTSGFSHVSKLSQISTVKLFSKAVLLLLLLLIMIMLAFLQHFHCKYGILLPIFPL
jgi:hypothetical protein